MRVIGGHRTAVAWTQAGRTDWVEVCFVYWRACFGRVANLVQQLEVEMSLINKMESISQRKTRIWRPVLTLIYLPRYLTCGYWTEAKKKGLYLPSPWLTTSFSLRIQLCVLFVVGFYTI